MKKFKRIRDLQEEREQEMDTMPVTVSRSIADLHDISVEYLLSKTDDASRYLKK